MVQIIFYLEEKSTLNMCNVGNYHCLFMTKLLFNDEILFEDITV